jgi:hypothetical protein
MTGSMKTRLTATVKTICKLFFVMRTFPHIIHLIRDRPYKDNDASHLALKTGNSAQLLKGEFLNSIRNINNYS